MKKFTNLFFLICFLQSAFFTAQGGFEKIYNTTKDRAFRDVIRLSDGGYMLCGWTNTSDPTESDVMVMRTDANGNELTGWPKFYGKSGAYKVDFAYSMCETSDGNYFLLGYSASYGGGDIDMVLYKIDINGNEVQPAKTFGSNKFDEGRKIMKTQDGNYMICGTITLNDNQDVCLIKIDVNGNPLWNPPYKTFGSPSREFGNAIQETSTGGFIIAGQTMENDSKGDAYFVKTNSSGVADWTKSYGEPKGDEATGLVIEPDGSFITCIRDSNAIGGMEDIDIIIRKFDANGDPVANYKQIYGGDSKDTPKTMSRAKDGNIYVGAISRSYNWRGQNPTMDFPDMWLLKIEAATGYTLWTRNFGANDHDHCEQAIADPVDNAILLCGHQVQQPYVKKSYFLKLNADGVVGPLAINENHLFSSTVIYPNPVRDQLLITSPSSLQIDRLQIVNYIGQVVLTESDVQLDAEQSKQLNLAGLSAGVYVLSFQNAKGAYAQKIIIE